METARQEPRSFIGQHHPSKKDRAALRRERGTVRKAGLSPFPYAGMTQIRLLGFALRPVFFRPPLTVRRSIVPGSEAVKRGVAGGAALLRSEARRVRGFRAFRKEHGHLPVVDRLPRQVEIPFARDHPGVAWESRAYEQRFVVRAQDRDPIADRAGHFAPFEP